ncbi:MAG: hypothetical protein IPN17_08365 [Deltaproteobacteria bacterium]|nr:hypothetical protein [Deltaproteobacteria bacterium]
MIVALLAALLPGAIAALLPSDSLSVLPYCFRQLPNEQVDRLRSAVAGGAC